MITPLHPVSGADQLRLTCRDCSLTELCLPRGLPVDELERLESMVATRPPLGRGAALFNAGDECRSLYAVKSGSLKSVLPSADGEEQVVGFHLPGELVGLDGLSDNSHCCHAIALERTTVCAVPLERLKEFARQCPGFQATMVSFVGGEIRQDHAMLMLLAKRNAEQRLATFLVSLVDRRRERGLAAEQFSLTMSRYDIANYLGLAPETVSRLLGRFQEDGMIEVDRRELILLKIDALRDLAGENAADVAQVLREASRGGIR